MPPQSALGALAARRQRAVTPPRDIWDVDQMLADSKELVGELPVNRDATSSILADMEAGEVRRRNAPRLPDVGVVGALAQSAALPIRVASGFLGPGAGVGEGIAQGLEAISYLDGQPMPSNVASGSVLSDTVRSLGKVGTATAFGKLAAMNPLTSMLGPAAATAAPAAAAGGGAVRSLAARLINAPASIAQRTNAMGNPARAVIGAGAGAIEGAVPNLAQGAFTRAFDAGDVGAAFDADAAKLDLGLGVGLGGPMGALMAIRRGGAATGNALRGRATDPQGPVSSWPKQPDAAPWQPETDQAFAGQGSGWMNATPPVRPNNGGLGSIRGPAPRQRIAPPEVPGEPKQLLANNPPPHPFAMPPSSRPPAPTQEQLGSQAGDLIDPANNPYQGPVDPAGQPPGVPPVRQIPGRDGALDELLATLEAEPPRGRLPAGSPAADAAQPFAPPEGFFGTPPPVAPDVPRGRFPAGDPTAAAAEPFVPPTFEPPPPVAPPEPEFGASNPTRDSFFDAMRDDSLFPPPVAPETQMGPVEVQPFDRPTKTAQPNDMLGTPERVKFDGKSYTVWYRGRPAPVEGMSPQTFEAMHPDVAAQSPRSAKPIAPPSAMDDPVIADLLDQVRAERRGPPPPPPPTPPVPELTAAPDTVPVVRADSETTRFATPQEDVQPAPAPLDGDEAVDIEAMLRLADEQDAAVAPQGEPTPDEIEALLRQADEQDAAAAPRVEPEVEFVDPDAETTLANGSGDSSASIEAIRRQNAMKAKGESFVLIDRAGRETPLIGTDAVDQPAPKGTTKVKKFADGTVEILDENGGNIGAQQRAAKPAEAPPVADEPSELDRIVLEDTPTRPVKAEELFAGPNDVSDDLPTTKANLPEAEGITLADGDTPGTINQAGKFAPLGDDWRSHEPGKNKNLVIRKADGTYQVVKNNGGKTPKTWSKELAAVRESEAAARKAKEEQRLAGIAAKKAEREAAAATKAKAREAAGEPPEPVVAAPEYTPPMTADEASGDALPPGSRTVDPEAGPTVPPKVTRDSFTTKEGVTKNAVDVAFERAPTEALRGQLKEYGFRYIAWKQKWSFAIPEGSPLTQDEVEGAVQAILRGENPESVQAKINADSLTQKAAANATAEGRWAPDPTATKLFDRDLAPEAADRDVRRKVLLGMGWKNGKEGNRRIWTKPGDGMRGPVDAPSDPEVPPANPPQAEPPVARSASDATTTPTTTTQSGTGSSGGPGRDEIRISANKVKVDADAYQFKTVGVGAEGVNEKLRGAGSWREQTNKLNRVMLHERLDGSLYVVDGHQRVGLAKRLLAEGKDVPDLYAVVLRESEGVTVDDARREGAMENLVGGTTDPVDIARVMRSGDLTADEQAQVGKIQAESGERFRQGRDIAALEDDAFNYLLQTGDSIEPRFSRLVSQYKGDKLQVALLRALEQGDPQNVSAAKSILAKAADSQLTESQPDIWGNVTLDTNAADMVRYEQKILGIFKKNRRLFGKSADNAAFLEQAGATKIDREAMSGISTEAQKAEFLFDKYVNASGSHTKQAIKETFDEVNAGRLSLGAAADRVAKALEADFTGRPPGGPPSAGDIAPGAGDDGPGLFDPEGQSEPAGGLFDDGAVKAGRADDTIEDAADDMLDFAKNAFKKLMDDERGSITLTPGRGLAGLEKLYKRNPQAAFAALRMAGGAFWGAATADEDGASILDDMVFGAAAGYAVGKAPKLARALRAKAPEFYKALKQTIENGRIAGRGEWKAVPVARKPVSNKDDIGGIAMKFWSPDKVVPDLWKHIDPIMQDIRAIDDGRATTVFEARIARRALMDQAIMALKADAAKSRTKGHHRRVKYVESLLDELRNMPTWMEKHISEATSGKVGVKTVRKVNAIATNAIYHNLLGWAVDSGLANMTQALMNIPQIGVRSTLKGMKYAASKEGRDALRHLNVKRPVGADDDRLFHPWIEKYLDWSQKPMSMSDSFNRRATYAGAMDYAARQGMSKADATDFARTLMGQTQGVAGELGNNPFHRHLGPLRVFTKYPLIWLSMVQDVAQHPDPRVQMRAIAMMTGIFAGSAISGIEWMNFFWPRMGGLPGPRIALDLLDHAVGAPEHDFEEHMEVGGTEDRVFPRAWNKNAAIITRFGDHGSAPRDIVGRKGQVLREVDAGEDLLSMFGVETTNRAAARKEESDMYDFAAETRREEAILSRRRRREAGVALSAGDDERATSALDALTKRQRDTFLRERRMTTRQRARRQTPTSRRDEFDEQYQEEQ